MKFNIVTIFPQIFNSYFNESILARAQKNNLIEIRINNLRDWATDKHSTVDDTPYGGGAGMVLKVEPIFNCIKSIKDNFQFPISNFQSISNDKIFNEEKEKNATTRTILFSAKGKKYTQADAKRLLQYENLILICGRYEGVDERVAEHIADEEFSIGEYVLTGGEIPAMIVVDSVSRLLPGVLGNSESLIDESFNSSSESTVNGSETKQDKDNSELIVDSSQAETNNLKFDIGNLEFRREYPHYTKPEEFNDWKVPPVLMNGNHKEINKWRKENLK